VIKDLKISDLIILEKENLPSLFNGPFKLRKTIYSKDREILGSFWVRVTAEISILLREDLSNYKRARVINEIGNYLYNEIPSQLGISDSFITFDKDFDERYIEILKKHFDFKEIRTLIVRRNDG
jgi:hypothetical protein